MIKTYKKQTLYLNDLLILLNKHFKDKENKQMQFFWKYKQDNIFLWVDFTFNKDDILNIENLIGYIQNKNFEYDIKIELKINKTKWFIWLNDYTILTYTIL